MDSKGLFNTLSFKIDKITICFTKQKCTTYFSLSRRLPFLVVLMLLSFNSFIFVLFQSLNKELVNIDLNAHKKCNILLSQGAKFMLFKELI